MDDNLKLTKSEYDEGLSAILGHYAMPVLLQEVDAILNNIKNGCMSVPLDSDPEKAALALYRERMKYEGALAVKNALVMKVKSYKEKKRNL